MHYLSKHYDEKIVNALFNSKYAIDFRVRDKNKNEPIHYAAYYRNEHMISKLLEKGAKVNV